MIDERRHLYNTVRVNDNRELDYLDTSITKMDLDVTDSFRVSVNYQFRPDLISYRFYRSFHFGWLILDYNNILDVYDELVVGKELLIPDIQQYYSFFNRYSR